MWANFLHIYTITNIVIRDWLSFACNKHLKQLELLKLILSIFLQYLQRKILRILLALETICLFQVGFTTYNIKQIFLVATLRNKETRYLYIQQKLKLIV